MYLRDIQLRLLALARRRIQAGILSERSLAFKCAISQPHMHNVLNDIRSLSTDAADRLMRILEVTAADLLWPDSAEAGMGLRGVPMLRNKIGPGAAPLLTMFRGVMPFPAALVAGLVDPVAGRLAPDLQLPPELAANDVVLLDQNPSAIGSIWIIAGEAGLFARRVTVAVDPDAVKARIVWIGREIL